MIITPKRNLLQRALNRALNGYGIKPFPVAFESDLPEAGSEPDTIFNSIYASNYWNSEETKSGPGSEIAGTRAYRSQLVRALKDFNIKSMFDAPCGDLNWMPRALAEVDLRYIGGDIAKDAIEAARRRCPNLDLRFLDICSDEFPGADLWHCRDTLFHLSFYDIGRVFARAREASIEFAAITTHRARLLRNLDIKTGGYRLIDLERAPFHFPRPARYLPDYKKGEFPRFVGIWRMSDLPWKKLSALCDPAHRRDIAR